MARKKSFHKVVSTVIAATITGGCTVITGVISTNGLKEATKPQVIIQNMEINQWITNKYISENDNTELEQRIKDIESRLENYERELSDEGARGVGGNGFKAPVGESSVGGNGLSKSPVGGSGPSGPPINELPEAREGGRGIIGDLASNSGTSDGNVAGNGLSKPPAYELPESSIRSGLSGNVTIKAGMPDNSTEGDAQSPIHKGLPESSTEGND